MRFESMHVLITGGARGIGLEIATHFAREGATLSIFDVNAADFLKAERTLALPPDRIRFYTVDVSVKAQVDKAVEEADSIHPIDVLVNNAGIAFENKFLDIDEQQWRRVLDVNLTGMFFVAQAVCRNMKKRSRGVVINMSSKNGLDGESGYAHYNASKGGVVMLTKTMAVELATDGIRVNAVCPGYIQTPMSAEIDSPEFVRKFADRYIPLNRPGTVQEVAPIFLFLASDESSFITGQTFVVDGGQLAGQKPF